MRSFFYVLLASLLVLGQTGAAFAANPHSGNPHGMMVGKPSGHGDTDRGHSEGQGHNDRPHHRHHHPTHPTHPAHPHHPGKRHMH
jgi:hypothetical protein